MLQNIFPHHFHNEYKIRNPKDSDIVMIFHNNEPLLYKDADTFHLITYQQLFQLIPNSCKKAQYLFSIDELGFFLIPSISICSSEDSIDITQQLPSQYQFASMREFRHFQPEYMGFAGVTAGQLYRWYKSNRFCGVCGHPMEHHPLERAMKCPACNYVDYPKICPAVIVGVIHGERILLTKYANRSFTRYALIAGFTEFGETLEDTVRREVLEEVGLKVKNIRYYKNQPWAFSESILVGFFADLDGDDSITLDSNELAVGEFVNREEIPTDEENGLSLTYTMMQAFKNGEIK